LCIEDYEECWWNTTVMDVANKMEFRHTGVQVKEYFTKNIWDSVFYIEILTSM
jgi:hypothetical protein